MDGADQRLQLRLVEELDLIEEEDHASFMCFCCLTDCFENVSKILVEVSGVGSADSRVAIESHGDSARGINCQGERLDDGCGGLRPILPPRLRRHIEQGTACEVGNLRCKWGVL